MNLHPFEREYNVGTGWRIGFVSAPITPTGRSLSAQPRRATLNWTGDPAVPIPGQERLCGKWALPWMLDIGPFPEEDLVSTDASW